jgi:hypothetical protein
MAVLSQHPLKTAGFRKMVARLGEREEAGQQDRPDRIDVLQGIELTRPSLHAVSSPRKCATKPCAAS